MDSAADIHICTNQELFDTLHTEGDFGYVNVENKLKQKIEGIGKVRLKLRNDKIRIISNVMYVPMGGANIISLGEFASQGHKYVGIGNWFKVYKDGNLVMQGRKKGKNIYYLDGYALSTSKMKSSRIEDVQKTERRIQFSDKVERLGTLEKGRICCSAFSKSHIDEDTEEGRP